MKLHAWRWQTRLHAREVIAVQAGTVKGVPNPPMHNRCNEMLVTVRLLKNAKPLIVEQLAGQPRRRTMNLDRWMLVCCA